MANNSLIYLVTPTVASVAQYGVLPLTTIVRRRGACIQQANDSIILSASGYYRVSVSETFTAPAAGVVILQIRQDNNPVTGGTASASIVTATTEVDSLTAESIIRVNCCNGPVTLTFINTGVAITTSNIAVNVEYLD